MPESGATSLANPKRFNVRQAAAMLDITPSAVRRAVTQERITPEIVYGPVGRTGYFYEFTAEEIERYKSSPRRSGGRPRFITPAGRG